MDQPLRVLLVDDQKLVRAGFAMMFSVEPRIDVVGEACDGNEALVKARELKPDVILMDVEMPECNGIDATRNIVAELDARILILTTFEREDYLFDCLQAGASGFLLKNTEPEHLVQAVLTAGEGHALLAPEVTGTVIRHGVDGRGRAQDSTVDHEGVDRLTDREREVLALVAKGLSNAEIAGELFVGEATVKTHVSSCLSKLHLRDRVQLVVFAYESGLATPPSDGG